MRLFAVPLIGLALVAASDAPVVQSPLGNEAYQEPASTWVTIEDVDPSKPAVTQIERFLKELRGENCRDVISKAREDAGLPPILQRETASPDKPLPFYAVDRRENGCSVMVMMGNTNDIRPLPELPEGPVQMIPAENGR